MADVCESHLERMGKELKCPICLSLLNSAVSLTCNHVFCNTCIEKSMKLASDCPLCKVPYRRREIRSAPHMDNLVSVYKSMEVASGVDIHVTQNAVSTKILGRYNQTGNNIYVAPYNGEAHLGNLDNENIKQCERKVSKRASMNNPSPFGSNSVRPSFPTKKRIQVNPTPETQMPLEKLGSRIGGTDRNQPEDGPVLQKEDTPSICEKKGHNFVPFFWLREEIDLEKSSQQTDGDHDMYTPPEAPCFSDIKESDDDVPCKISPKRETDILSNSVDFIGSEMFEWTQRPCSPELCSNSLAMQIEDTAEHHEAEQKGEAAITHETKGLNIIPKKREGMRMRIGKISGNKSRVNLSNAGDSDATETRQRKRTNKTAIHVEPEKVTNQDMLEKSDDKDKLLRVKRKNCKNNTVISENTIHEKAAENKSSMSRATNDLSNNNKTASVNLSALQGLKNSSKRSCKLKRSCQSGNNTKRMNTRQEKPGGRVKAGMCETVNDQVNGEQTNEDLISHSNNNFLPLSKGNEVLDRGMTIKTCESNRKKMSKSLKTVKFSTEGTSKGDCAGFPVSADVEAAVTGKIFQEIQGTKYQTGIKSPETMDTAIPTLNCTVLRKCKTLPSTIYCAFCQSSGESEASGVMAHYLEGKLVIDSNNARSNAVHVHKYCTEWAPNVYFENENVINLENELSRSRRIGCSCCGKKGAALGCYEKTCRKSFHVSCARLTPGCRWDYENFVMLCPIHASCQLPNEISKSQCTKKRKCAPESKSNDHHVKATDESKSVSVLPWKSQKRFKNLVLCCSALTNSEKDIVYEFEKLSGVTIMKNWDSSITHIIASTDENGVCRRTLKFLMGVLGGKWILDVVWLKACIETGELVDEQSFEIAVDIHGIRDGPRLGRLRLLNKQTKLFDGYTFFFMGDFAPSYKGYLHDLVIAAGGKILNRKPVKGDQAIETTTFIIYSLELPEKCTLSNANSLVNNRLADAEAVANSTGSLVATNSWILNSIAGYKLQNEV